MPATKQFFLLFSAFNTQNQQKPNIEINQRILHVFNRQGGKKKKYRCIFVALALREKIKNLKPAHSPVENMNIPESIINPLRNCEYAAFQLCKALNVPVTKTSLVYSILEHPDYPSLLSIGDVLKTYGIDNLSLRIVEHEKLKELACPFIAQIRNDKTYNQFFAVIYAVRENKIAWLNPETRKKENITFESFLTYFTGYVQLYEIDSDAGEKDYMRKLKKEKKENFINSCLVFVIPILTIIGSAFAFNIYGLDALLADGEYQIRVITEGKGVFIGNFIL